MHVECPPSPKEILSDMPTDDTISEFYRAAEARESEKTCSMWGTAVGWSDLHASGPYRIDYD